MPTIDHCQNLLEKVRLSRNSWKRHRKGLRAWPSDSMDSPVMDDNAVMDYHGLRCSGCASRTSVDQASSTTQSQSPTDCALNASTTENGRNPNPSSWAILLC